MNNIIKAGSIYTSRDYKKFTVEKLTKDHNETWIYYRDDTRSYSCLLDAFLARFTEVTNENRK